MDFSARRWHASGTFQSGSQSGAIRRNQAHSSRSSDVMLKHNDPARQRMVALLERLAPLEGYNLTALPDVRFLRSNRPLRRTPVLYDPRIVIVCHGRKRGFLGDTVYVYDAQHYLAVSVPVVVILSD